MSSEDKTGVNEEVLYTEWFMKCLIWVFDIKKSQQYKVLPHRRDREHFEETTHFHPEKYKVRGPVSRTKLVKTRAGATGRSFGV